MASFHVKFASRKTPRNLIEPDREIVCYLFLVRAKPEKCHFFY